MRHLHMNTLGPGRAMRRAPLLLLPLALGLALTALLLGAAGSAQADTSDCILEAGIDSLQAAVSDTTCPVITLGAGNFLGTVEVTRSVEIHGAGAGSTFVDGVYGGSVVTIVHVTNTVVISGVTIERGLAENGGGIYNNGSLTLANSIVADNYISSTLNSGGGIYNDGTLTLVDTRVERNTGNNGSLSSIVYGAGIYNGFDGQLTLLGDTRLTSNTTTAATSIAFGGGLYNAGTAHITGGQITQNALRGSTLGGGGIYNHLGGRLTVDGTLVASNTLTGTSGGGAGLSNVGTLTASLVLVQGNVVSPTSGSGGGLDNTGTAVWTGGSFEANQASTRGGGVDNSGQLTLSLATLADNQSESGGGLMNYGTVTDTDSYYDGNLAKLGGGLYNEAVYFGLDTTFIRNAASDDGGGVYNAEAVSLIGATFNNNTAGGDGGGLYSSQPLTLTHVTLVLNVADGDGGGLYSSARLLLRDSTFIDNAASGHGAGLYREAGVLLASNTTWSDNAGISAGSAGAGLYLAGGALADLNNTTIASNTVAGGLAAGLVVTGPAEATLRNSLLAHNTNLNCGGTGTITSGGHNLEAADDCGFALAGDQPNTDPLIGRAAFNGGPVPTHALLAGSPALDAGDGLTCANSDARGVDRPVGAGCDIGAYEALQLSVADAAVLEGHSGESSLDFTVEAGGVVPPPFAVTTTYTITGGTATPGVDFVAASGVLTITPGSVTTTVSVDILGDISTEDDETLVITLAPPARAILSDAQAVGTILDDDLYWLYMPLILR